LVKVLKIIKNVAKSGESTCKRRNSNMLEYNEIDSRMSDYFALILITAHDISVPELICQ